MQAYEFYAKPENGVIHIPQELRNQITSNVKVIILERKSQDVLKETNVKHKSDLLLPPTLDTAGWKFNREEANER